MAEILTRVQESAGVDGDDLADLLVRVGRDAMDVTGVWLSSMTGDGSKALLAATDRSARVVEELQFSLGEGPCIDSFTTGLPVLNGDLARTGSKRWPWFTAGALDAGIAAVFAFPVQIGAIPLGALALYRDAVGSLRDADVREAMALADAAAALLLHLHSSSQHGQLHPILADGLMHRAVVQQATGMVAVQVDADLADALSVLRARAFASSRPITDIARHVVARHLRFTP